MTIEDFITILIDNHNQSTSTNDHVIVTLKSMKGVLISIQKHLTDGSLTEESISNILTNLNHKIENI